MTGIRIGIILQAISSSATALAIAFPAGWKLSLVVLCFVPLMMMAGKLQARQRHTVRLQADKNSYVEQGGLVRKSFMMKISITFLRLFQHATEAIEYIRTVAALHREDHFINLYEHAFNHEFK